MVSCHNIQAKPKENNHLPTCLWYIVSDELYCIAFEQIKNTSLCIQQLHSKVSKIICFNAPLGQESAIYVQFKIDSDDKANKDRDFNEIKGSLLR